MKPLRQNIMSNGRSCDIVVSDDALSQFASLAHGLTGKAGRALVFVASEVSSDQQTLLEKTCIAAEYNTTCKHYSVERSLKGLLCVLHEAEKCELTKDDLFVALGPTFHVETLAYAAAMWCKGTPYIAFPTELSALISLPSHPCALEVKKHALAEPNFRVDACLAEPTFLASDDKVAVGVLATQAAVAESKEALDEVARLLVYGNAYELAVLGARWTGNVSSATHASLRGALKYGTEFALALCSAIPGLSFLEALGEGMRFSSRLAVSALDCSLDLVQLQDKLLKKIGARFAKTDISADVLFDIFMQELYRRERRLLLALPFTAGRIRQVPVEKDLVKEHIEAWTESRKEQ